MRGLTKFYNYGDDDSLSITDLLKRPEVVNYLEQGKELTYASQREKIRKELRKHGNNFKDIVAEYNLENPVEQERQQQRDILYGSQRGRRNLPKKDTKGRVLFGPEKPPGPPREPRISILINGERLTARQALEKYPQLREELQKKRKISEKSLQAKYRAWMRKGKITKEMLGPPFEVIRVGSNSNAKFPTYFDSYTIKVNRYPIDPVNAFQKTIDITINERGLVTGDKIRLIVSHPTWVKPFSTKLLTITNDENFIYALIKSVLEFVEYKSVPLSELLVEVQSTKIPKGTGRLTVDADNVVNKTSVVCIKNDDTMCLARAIVTAHALLNPSKWTKSQIKNGFKASRKLQEDEARKLHEEAGVEISDHGNTLEDVDTFARHLGVQINVVDADYFNEIIYTTEQDSVDGKMIYLYKNKNHFDVITSMPGFLGKSYYCHTCKTSYKRRNCHKCPTKCLSCFKSDSDCSGEEITCRDCNRTFVGQKCFDEHKRNRSKGKDANIVCDMVKKCLKCKRIVENLKEHVCGFSMCGNCGKYCDPNLHKCYMKIVETKGGHCTNFSGTKNTVVANDEKRQEQKSKDEIETILKVREIGWDKEEIRDMVDWTEEEIEEVLNLTDEEIENMKKPRKFETRKEIGCGGLKPENRCLCCKTYTHNYMFYDFETQQDTGTHIVNYVNVQNFSGTEWTFDTIDEFCKFVFQNKHKHYTFIAHNAKSFDAQFVLKYCVENRIKPFCIYNGTKIMYMQVEEFKIRFIDSINFVQSKLANFPKTFGLAEMKKGYFPHFFNVPENQDYVGKIPDVKYYGPDQMSPDGREKFLKWHQERVNENYVFDFKKELKDYCRSDVDILRRSMLKFREDFITIANIDPLQYITIASVCMNVYRSKFMPKRTIGIIKDSVRTETFSKISINWLKWIFDTNDGKIRIQHALNGGEHVIPNVGKVDGFCKSTNTVYEFQGCFWHGCEKCYTKDTINPWNQVEMGELQNRTQIKNQKIRDLGYNLVEIYECELAKNAEFKKWAKTNDIEIVTPLNPRDAFFGGRTNVTKLKYDFKDDEKGRYVDFVSLYPTVQYFKTYPVGHPTKILNPTKYNDKWFGFVKCKIDPPQDLYHPVLPFRTTCGKSEKLLFPLCRTCAERQQQARCEHTEEERAITGTWCTNEINKAIEKGYRIVKIYEVWNFRRTTDTLFRDYVKEFMRIKMENSKPPVVGENCTYESVDEFKRIVKERLDIDLGEIKFNAGMRQISKLCLNSLWGKFGQRLNLTQTEYVVEPKEFYSILLDDTVDDLHIQFLTDDMVQMNFNLKNKLVDNHNNTNIFVAAFTTSHAREMLYGVLDKLGDQVLGYDTDSCWCVDRPGGNVIDTGDSLGDLTDELEGDHITEWRGTGPKSYSYKTNKGKVVCKVKGFTLNYQNSKKINGEVMDSIIEDPTKTVCINKKGAITRDSKTKNVVNRDQTKQFSLGYNKRIVINDYDTVPYGTK